MSGRSINHFNSESLECFWSLVGQLPLPASEAGDKRFQNLANFCKLLLVLPHSTADPRRLFSVIGSLIHLNKVVFSRALFMTFYLICQT